MRIKNVTPENIIDLDDNEIFVFGSNLSGRHGKGAAKIAYSKFGAVYGIGIGHMGNTYSIPTKDENLKTLLIEEIQIYVNDLLEFVKDRVDLHFYITKIGCGLAGYKPEQIAPLFKEFKNLDNISLPKEFFNYI
jgi:hypothetical protein